MKHIFIILFTLSMLTLTGQGVPVDSSKIDTVQITMLWSQCNFCNPQTNIGFAEFKIKDIEGRKEVEILKYMDQDFRPLSSQAIVWMANVKKKE